MGRKQATIMGVNLDSTSYQGVLAFVASKLQKKEKFYIVTPNPEIVLKARLDQDLQNILNKADLSIPDGAGLVWANYVLNGETLKRLPGRKVMRELLVMANEKKLKVYFLGSTKRVIAKTLRKIAAEYPKISAKGDSGPTLSDKARPVTKVDVKSQIDIVKEINNFQPDLLFVAFGAPKQERWIANNISNLKIGGAMAVGGSIDTFSGEIKASPEWMAKIGLEWLWRLIQEPARAGRIVNAVIIFPLLILYERIQQK